MTEAAPPPRLIEDVWMQVFGLLTIIAGIFTVAAYGPMLQSWVRRPAPPPAVDADPAAPPKAADTGHVGPWIVDAKGASDSDFSAL
jgi:hypothetical protein